MENFTHMMHPEMAQQETASFPIVVTVGKVSVKIYRHKLLSGHQTHLVQLRRHGHVYRVYRAKLDEARAEAKKMATNLNRDETGAAKTSLRDLAYYRKCERALDGVPLHVAVAHYLASTVTITKKASVPVVVKEYLAVLKADETLSPQHVVTRRSHLRRFAEDFKTSNILEVTSKKIDDYLTQEKWQKSTRHNVRRSLIAFFNYAQRKGYIPRHSRTEAELSEKIRFNTKVPEVYSVAEMRALLTNAGFEAVPFIAIGAFAGIRYEEMMRLSWSNFLWDDKVIQLYRDETKTRRERQIPILPNLRKWLEPYRDLKGNIAKSLGIHSNLPLRTKFHEATGAAGLDWIRNGLRHSFATYYLAYTEDAEKTSLACGHSVDVLKSIYKTIQVDGAPITKFLAEEYFSIVPSVL